MRRADGSLLVHSDSVEVLHTAHRKPALSSSGVEMSVILRSTSKLGCCLLVSQSTIDGDDGRLLMTAFSGNTTTRVASTSSTVRLVVRTVTSLGVQAVIGCRWKNKSWACWVVGMTLENAMTSTS